MLPPRYIPDGSSGIAYPIHVPTIECMEVKMLHQQSRNKAVRHRLGRPDFARNFAAVQIEREARRQSLGTVGMCRAQIRRGGAGTSHPAQDVKRTLAIASPIGTHAFACDEDQRGLDRDPSPLQRALDEPRDDDGKIRVLELIKSVRLSHKFLTRPTGKAC